MSIFSTNYTYQPHPDGDDDPFDDDFLMQPNNRVAAIKVGDPTNDISDLSILRRERTRAPDLIKYVDDTMHFQGLAVDDDDLFEKMSRDYGTSHELARKYNGGSQAERDWIKQGVNTALDWEAKATNRQRAAQRRAVEKIGDYKTASTGPKYGGSYNDMGNLTSGEVESFFHGTPEGRKAIAAPLNAALQPWLPDASAPRVSAVGRWDLTEEEKGNQRQLAGAVSLTPDQDLRNQRAGTGNQQKFAAKTFAATKVLGAQAPTFSSETPPPGEPIPHPRHRDLPPVNTKPYAPPTSWEMDYVIDVLDELFPSNGLMKRIAIVESQEGKHNDTARQGYHGGVIQVDKAAFQETQKQPGLKRQREIVSKRINRDWNSVTWEELRTSPLLSGLAARLYLLRLKKRIPQDISGQAEYWKDHYNGDDGAGTKQKFIRRLNEYKR